VSNESRVINSSTAIVLGNREFNRLSAFIYEHCGIKMPPAKRTMLEARLQKRLRTIGYTCFAEYCDFLMSPQGMQQELVAMIDLVTTNKTDFFREPEHFAYLTGRVLPEWFRENGRGRKLKIWSAGCSSGEEPYTLSMVLSDFAEANPGFGFEILATDISTRVLEKARTAVYEEDRVEDIPLASKRKYLLRSRERDRALVRIVPELRQKVRFGRLNFMDEDFGLPEKMDIIFCRNVVIYFDRQTQERLFNKFHNNLKTGGHLFIGHSETLNGLDVPFVQTFPTVYRREN